MSLYLHSYGLLNGRANLYKVKMMLWISLFLLVIPELEPEPVRLKAGGRQGDISGIYLAKGVDHKGKKYWSVVTVVHQSKVAGGNGDGPYIVRWSYLSEAFVGVGMLKGDKFVIGYGQEDKTGISAYVYSMKVEGNSLTGVYASIGAARLGTETWELLGLLPKE